MIQKSLGLLIGLLFPIYLESTVNDRVSNDGQLVFCESLDGNYLECNIGFVIKKAKVDLELSQSKCSEDVSWGYGPKHLWVKDSCRASFRVYAH